MTQTEQQLGTLTLIQAIEMESESDSVMPRQERIKATRDALVLARAENVPGANSSADSLLMQVLLRRSEFLLETLRRKSPGLASIAGQWAWLTRLLTLVPVLALIVGFTSDRISDPHRLDLLSPPLLLVLAWNVFIYGLLVVRGLMPRAAGPVTAHWLTNTWRQLMTRRGGLRMRVMNRFVDLWAALASRLFLQRCTAAMHLAAAAWAAGIAASLLLRGVFVLYSAGWESTFLDAAQVHTVLRNLFWPLTTLFGVQPFSLADIAAMQNFKGAGQGGRHWVLLYCGLLLMVVVLPRLALAGLALRRARVLRSAQAADLSAPYFQQLASQLPRDVKVGLLVSEAWQMQALKRSWRTEGDTAGQLLTVRSAEGDLLRFVLPGDPDAAAPVDLVLDAAQGSAPLPPLWAQAPRAELPWSSFGRSWVLEPRAFDALTQRAPPALRHALVRLRDAVTALGEQRLFNSAAMLAQHMTSCMAALERSDFEAAYALARQQLQAQLAELHGWPPLGVNAADAQADATADTPQAGGMALWRGTGAVTAAGATAGAAAGALAGAKFGAALDLATGGATLGAGTVAGALGGAAAWVVQAWRKKGQKDEAQRRIAEDALTNYLAIAHLGRDSDIATSPEGAATGTRWQSESIAEVGVRWPMFELALKTGQSTNAPLADAFKAAACQLLQREFDVAGIATASSTA
jgi:hypothetical protein